MMIMRRREGEKILIGDDIVIHIAQIGRNRVRIGIEAPRSLTVQAEEARRVTQANAAAAKTSPDAVLELIARIQQAAAGAGGSVIR